MDNYLVRILATDISYLRCLNTSYHENMIHSPQQKKLEKHINLLEQVVRNIQSMPKAPLES